MADDSSIVFRVEADDQAAQKKLEQLRKDMERTANALGKTNTQHNGLVTALNAAKEKAKETAAEIEKTQAAVYKTSNAINEKKYSGGGAMIPPEVYADLTAQRTALLAKQSGLQAQLAAENAEVEKLSRKEEKLKDTLQQQTEQLKQQKQDAGRIEAAIAQTASRSMPQLKEASAAATSAMRSGVKSILKWGFGIRSTFILFRRLRTYIKDAVFAFAEQDEETKNNVNGLKSALQSLKLSWGAAFAPILNAVAPLLQTLISWLQAAANAVARFFAVLGGKTSYKKAVSSINALADSYGAAGSAAKEASKSVLGFDELNKLNDDSSSGGGGGGASSPATELVEEMIDSSSLASRLAFAVKDVLFDWHDLNQEQIAEKALAGLLGLGGMIVGGMISGVPGAIIGLVAGLALGILADATIFNFDGQLSQDELWKALKIAFFTVGGGILGLTFGPAGAVIGAAIGFALSFTEITIGFDSVKAKIDEWAQNVKNYFLGYINKWKQRGSEQSNSVGLYIVLGILEGLADGVAEIGKWIYGRVIKPIIDFFKDGFGIHSPSTVMAEIGSELIAGLWNGIETKWASFLTWIQGKWNSLKSWWSGLSLGSFSFNLPHLEVSWQELASNSIISKLFGISAIPHFSVAWYAKGGIVDGATLIGVGEQGKEAIIPLERNTEWIKQVALELMDAMESRYRGALVGMPAMASGQIVPPRAAAGAGFGLSDAEITRMISGLEDAIRSTPIEVDLTSKTYLDGRQIATSVTKFQREISRETGR